MVLSEKNGLERCGEDLSNFLSLLFPPALYILGRDIPKAPWIP